MKSESEAAPCPTAERRNTPFKTQKAAGVPDRLRKVRQSIPNCFF